MSIEKNGDKSPNNKRKRQTPKERLKILMERHARADEAVRQSLASLEKRKTARDNLATEIAAVQMEIAGLDFLNIKPDEFVLMHDNLERQQISTSEILKLLANGDFEKLQEIYSALKDADIAVTI